MYLIVWIDPYGDVGMDCQYNGKLLIRVVLGLVHMRRLQQRLVRYMSITVSLIRR